MELHHLRTFVIVAEEQNVTRAARRLFMTPPAVSAHIKALEEELNTTLFVRLPQGMQITEKGALLKIKAHHILQAAQDLVNHATQLQDELIGRLVIGLNAVPSLLRVVSLITRMKSVCPGIELAFVNSVSGVILNRLQDGTLDAGFIFGDSPAPSVIAIPLMVADLVIAAPASWAAQLQHAAWQDLAQLPWITSSGYCPFQTLIDALFAEHGLTVMQLVQCDDDTTKCELVKAGLGLALLERSEAEQADDIILWQHDPIRCSLSLALAKDRLDDPLVKALMSQVVNLWDSAPSPIEP